MNDFDFDKDQEQKIIDSLNKQQNIYTITHINKLLSKNPIYFGFKRICSTTKSNNKSQKSKQKIKSPQIFEDVDEKQSCVLKLIKYHSKKQISNFDREKNILDSFIDDNRIIKYIDIIPVQMYMKKHILVSMKYYNCMDLLFFLWRPSFTFDEQIIRLIAFKILKILELLKSKEVVHNDIKFENFLVLSDDPLEITLTDFESAQMVNSEGKSTLIAGTPIFKSPEVLRKEAHDYKSDIWSFAVPLFYHLCNEYPFGIKEEENKESFESLVLTKIESNQIIRKNEYKVSDEAWECLSLMLKKDANERINVEDALKLSWFKYIDDSDSMLSPTREYFDYNCDSNDDIYF